jgi:hypothetical protein
LGVVLGVGVAYLTAVVDRIWAYLDCASDGPAGKKAEIRHARSAWDISRVAPFHAAVRTATRGI